MNLHEYQAKELLKTYGMPVPPGIAASTPDEADKAAATLAPALTTFKKMPAAGQAWLQNSLSRLDTSTAAWVVGRMASIHRANSN